MPESGKASVMTMSLPFAPGVHILLDLHGPVTLTDKARLDAALLGAARAGGATVLSCHLHEFGEGGGITGVALLAESHISIHTWPERDYAAVDIFMCGSADARAAADHLVTALEPRRVNRTEVLRGQGNQVAQPSR